MNLDDFLVCPISKQPLKRVGDDFHAPCGFVYPHGDFRVDIDFSSHWQQEQAEYERWVQSWREENERIEGRIESVDESFRDVYDQIHMEGTVLDVGGDIGTVVTQADLDPQQYVSLDPMRIDFAEIERRYPKYFNHYRRSATASTIQGSAEFLPVRDLSFDNVHMRGCIDHFAAPHIALREAYRVLKPEGSLIVGVSLEGAYQKEIRAPKPVRNYPALEKLYHTGLTRLKEYPRVFSFASGLKTKLKGVHDVHTFHPTYDGLMKLLEGESFRVEKEVWQSAYHNVIYVQAVKVPPWRGTDREPEKVTEGLLPS